MYLCAASRCSLLLFFFQAEDGIRDYKVTGVQTCALPISLEYLRTEWPKLKSLFVLGTPSMCKEFEAAGFLQVPEDADVEPDAVIVGFDKIGRASCRERV